MRYSFANQVAGRIQQWDLVGIMSPSKRPARGSPSTLRFVIRERAPLGALSRGRDTRDTRYPTADTLLPQYPSQRKQRVLADSFSCFPIQERVRSRRRPRLRVDTPCKTAFYFFLSSRSLLLLFLSLSLCFFSHFFLCPFCVILLGLYVSTSLPGTTLPGSTCDRFSLRIWMLDKESFPVEASGKCKGRAVLYAKVARVKFPVSVCQCRITQRDPRPAAWMLPAE